MGVLVVRLKIGLVHPAASGGVVGTAKKRVTFSKLALLDGEKEFNTACKEFKEVNRLEALQVRWNRETPGTACVDVPTPELIERSISAMCDIRLTEGEEIQAYPFR